MTDPLQNTIDRLVERGEALVKFTVSRPEQLRRSWYDLPPKATFDEALRQRGLLFTHDEAQDGDFYGVRFTTYRYTLVGQAGATSEAPRG